MVLSEPKYDVLIDEETVAKRVAEMGRQIALDYKGKNLTALVVLKGSFVFAADLLRSIDLPLRVEFIGLRSYGSRHETSGAVEITLDAKYPLSGHDVLIVEDIVDTGMTISYLKKNIATRMPASVKLASLLHKTARTIEDVKIDYLGFTVPNRFVVGYGLDESGLLRNLPFVGALRD
ncbi:MAG: hypoxanthine phosphoribosyltransferase [Proteobacteria bacterium]|nr:hypoxanthine phosphoribosyltransferase [Pseudomonadota bacterium]